MNYLDFISSTQELYQRILSPVSLIYCLTSMELTIILYLANNPGHDTAAEIIKKRHLTKSHVSISVRSLEEKGVLRKEYRNNDRRTIHLVLLDSAADIVREGQAAQKQFFEIMSGGLTEKRIADMGSCFEQMNLNVCQALEEK